MELLGKEQLKNLVNGSTGPCVSIFLPTHRGGAEVRQAPIRLKNLIREAEKQLSARRLRSTGIKQILEPAQQLCDNLGFWQYQSDGLALFCSPATLHHYRLPIRLEELVVVADRFHVKPLLRFFTEDGRFYLLALSQHEVRFFQCTHFGVRETELPPGTPKSLQEVLAVAGLERQLQVHTAGGASLYHGHGAASEDSKQDLREFFRQIDKGVRETLRDERAPLVLAGVDYLFPIYKEANGYANLVAGGVSGNPQGRRPEELQRDAWAVVEPHFRKIREQAATHYVESSGSGRASSNLREVVPAACQGRVEQLFVAVGHQQWGKFQPELQKVRISRKRRSGDEDLLDLAALETFLQGGSVFAVEPAQIPGGGPAAAVFRY